VRSLPLAALLSTAITSACERTVVDQSAGPGLASGSRLASRPGASSALSAAPVGESAPVHVERVSLENQRLAFVLRGAKGSGLGVFLHGLCGHGMGYLQSFQFAAAKRGVWVAPHGDVACGGELRSWSGKLPEIQRQIEAAFRAAGVTQPPKRATLVGYSLGATLALALARKHPEAYSRLVLIAAPSVPAPHGLSHLESVVMMSGTRDRRDLMQAGARAFTGAGIPATFQSLPDASHGQMGTSPETSMDVALTWLERNAKNTPK
jgi:pimeloyl-ACP methyl ester carboxylesterase